MVVRLCMTILYRSSQNGGATLWKFILIDPFMFMCVRVEPWLQYRHGVQKERSTGKGFRHAPLNTSTPPPPLLVRTDDTPTTQDVHEKHGLNLRGPPHASGRASRRVLPPGPFSLGHPSHSGDAILRGVVHGPRPRGGHGGEAVDPFAPRGEVGEGEAGTWEGMDSLPLRRLDLPSLPPALPPSFSPSLPLFRWWR